MGPFSLGDCFKKYREERKPKKPIILGAPDDESAEIAAETVVLGDPTYAGALAEAQLGLSVYHVLEEEFRSEVDADVYEEQIGVMADVLDAEAISAAVKGMREQAP